MIYIVDRFVEGYLHVLANVNTLKILDILCPGQPKIFIAEKSHSFLVQKQLGENKIQNLSFECYNAFSSKRSMLVQLARIIRRILSDLLFFWNLLRLARKDTNSFIFVTHIYPLSLVFLKVLKLFFPKVRIILTVHGEIEYLFYGKSIYEKFIGKLYAFSFRIKTAGFYYLFLTNVSKQILLRNKKLRINEILTIILPTLTKFVPENKDIKYPQDKILISHIGSAGKRKNTNFLYEIACDFKAEVKLNKVGFSIIGPIEENIKPFMNEYVLNFVNGQVNKSLDRNTFDLETEKIHYSIFFYGVTDFVLRSSAAFFDAINFEKPLIVLKNPFFVDVFDECGDLGYLCSDLQEMKTIIAKIIKNDLETQILYQNFVINIRKYKTTLKLSRIAEHLEYELKNVGFKINNS